MRHITLPSDPKGSHEAVLTLVDRAVAAGMEGNIRLVVARDPRDANGSWRPACARLDLVRGGDPPPLDCRPRGPARFLEERVGAADLLARVKRAMNGEPFVVCGEPFAQHGMESAWGAYQHTDDWAEYGTTWPCTVAAPHTQIPQRVHLYEVIEDDGPQGAHDGLEGLVHHAIGFRLTRGAGIDIRLSRFQLVLWDYRGRIDGMRLTHNRVVIGVSPREDPTLRLVGVVSGERTRKPIAVSAPGTVSVTLDEPILVAKVVLKVGDDAVAELQRDLPQEAAIARLEGRLPAPDACDVIFDGLARSLRPAFAAAPSSEKEVQYEVETILRAIGVAFHREKERAPVGATTFIPDFTVPDFALAIEVKFARPSHGEAAIQRELAQDAAGYGTRWSQIIVVVYDCGGVIRDPEGMRLANEQLGIRLLVVKH